MAAIPRPGAEEIAAAGIAMLAPSAAQVGKLPRHLKMLKA
jgi:hypothetical protein